MPEFNEETLQHLARLARIELPSAEADTLARDLQRILGYVTQLHEVDVEDIPPYAHLVEQSVEGLRDDVPGPLLPRARFLANAPDQVAGMIRVPAVLKQNP